MAQMVKNLPEMQETQVRSLGLEDTQGKGMATHSRSLAWRIPWTEEPGGLPSVGSQKLDRTKHTKKAHKVHKGRKKSITLPETNGFVSEIHIEMYWLG